MKRIFYLTGIFILYFFVAQNVSATAVKHIRIGNIQLKVVDSGDQGEVSGSFNFAYHAFDDFTNGIYSCNGYHLGTAGWVDENGTLFPVKISNSATASSDEVYNTMPLPDDEGITVRRYMRYQPPEIVVDGVRLDEQFPRRGDEVNPDKIPGTADIMVESWVRTSMGMTIHITALAWSQKHHDDYVVFDWTFTNTGNTDLDDEVELPNQTLKDVYFMRETRPAGGRRSWRPELFFSAYGECEGDSMRMVYSYPARTEGAAYDNLGYPDETTGFIRDVLYNGEIILHVDTSVDDPTDDWCQPQMTGVGHPEWMFAKHNASLTSPADHQELYNLMKLGNKQYDGTPEIPAEELQCTDTHHSVRMEDRGLRYTKELGYAGRGKSWYSCGPYTLKPGESFRVVWADVTGGLSPQKAWEVGTAWKDGTCTWDGPDNTPPHFELFPDLYAADEKSTAENNLAKDSWVFTGKDTLFRDAWAAQWNANHDYNIPIAPPPPSIEVTSLPDRINISWGNESESASDFAGYRVYRAIGNANPILYENDLLGSWEPVFECGQGTAHSEVVNSYDDIHAVRGQAYYYYVAAFDDGTENGPDVYNPQGGESLESGKYLNRTVYAAHLTRQPGTNLSDIRVVPNPFNVAARELQYTGEKDKIMFMDLPPECTIKIYSESGDLVKTLNHMDGSGDEAWGVLVDEQSTTETGQMIVSGIYIAFIQTPEGEHTFVKFAVVR